ncbi:MAG: glycoside hydrolase family 19 protein [Candidatus Binatia bacterium]
MAVTLTERQLRAIMPRSDPTTWLDPLNRAMAEFEIDNRHRVAAFLAQIAHESGELRRVVENLNYSAYGLLRTWPARFPTLERARLYARDPERIADYVYAGRLGNGREASGDGWRYRGRGLIQVTGRGTYREAGTALRLPLEAHPERLASPIPAARSAGWYWKSHLLNPLADDRSGDDDDEDFVVITRKINGGTTGLRERRAYWARARSVLGADWPPSRARRPRRARAT